MAPALITASLVTALVVACAGCSAPEGRPLGHRVAYELAWDTDGVQFAGDAKGWTVTNDRGYTIELTSGYLSTYSIAFLPCDDDPAARRPPVSGKLWQLLSVRTAHAGHASVAQNPAMLVPGHIEDLAAPRLRKTQTRRPPPTRFCRVHYLIARAERDAAELPDDHQMVGVSLFVEGYRYSDENPEPVAFRIETKAANGVAQRIVGAGGSEPLEVDTAGAAATATVTRKLATLFNGVDFAVMTDKQVSWEILKRVIEGTELTVTTGEGQ